MIALRNPMLLLVCIVVTSLMKAQVKKDPKEFVYSFFEAFHKRDTVLLTDFFNPNARLVSVTYPGVTPLIKEESIADFLEAVAAISPTLNFEERLGGVEIISGEAILLVATSYSFYVNQNYSHCGTNVFTLLPKGDTYEIISLYDTRLKVCSSSPIN